MNIQDCTDEEFEAETQRRAEIKKQKRYQELLAGRDENMYGDFDIPDVCYYEGTLGDAIRHAMDCSYFKADKIRTRRAFILVKIEQVTPQPPTDFDTVQVSDDYSHSWCLTNQSKFQLPNSEKDWLNIKKPVKGCEPMKIDGVWWWVKRH